MSSSAVDASGRFFHVVLAPDADEGAVLEAAGAILRGRARRLTPPEAAAQLAARTAGDPWFGARDVHTLSYLEGRVVAARAAAEIARAGGLGPQAADVVLEQVRVEVFRAVERVHARGGAPSSGWFQAAWPAIAAAVDAHCREALGQAWTANAAAALAALHAPDC